MRTRELPKTTLMEWDLNPIQSKTKLVGYSRNFGATITVVCFACRSWLQCLWLHEIDGSLSSSISIQGAFQHHEC